MAKLKLKAARINAGIKAKAVAEALNVCVTTVYSWENGKIDISISNALKLCEMYGVTINDVEFSKK